VERLRRAVEERSPSASAPYPLSLSIGEATFDVSRHARVQDLLDEADRSMYEDKAARTRERRGAAESRAGE
jgi:GGDEF domain-containing protein